MTKRSIHIIVFVRQCMIEILLPILSGRLRDTDVIGRPRDGHASLRRERVNKTEIDRDPCANNNE